MGIMKLTDIRYLIRFFDEEYKVKYLFDNGLFMNAASTYHRIEKDSLKWDYSEGAVCDCSAYKNSDRPIWCCSAAFEENIIDNHIVMDTQILDDFNCRNGYAVIFNTSKFLKAIEENPNNLHASSYGLIKYGKRNPGKILMNNHFASALFIKHPVFKHQQEFRYCIDYNCEKIFEKDINNVFKLGKEQDILVGYKPFIYKLDNIEHFSQVLSSKEFISNDKINIDLNNLDKNIFKL